MNTIGMEANLTTQTLKVILTAVLIIFLFVFRVYFLDATQLCVVKS